MRFVIIGGSAGLGRSLAEEAARRGHVVFLVASDPLDLAATVSDLRFRYGAEADFLACNFGAGASEEHRIVSALTRFGKTDGILYPVGQASTDDSGILDRSQTEQLMRVNLIALIHLTTALWRELLDRPRAYVVGFGSVAAIRGRQRNVVYAVAKRGLLSYFESLRHLASGTNVRVHFYQLGYMDTYQTFGKRLLFTKSSPQRLARYVFDHLDKDRAPIFYPRYWRAVAWIVRALPWSIYRRLNF